MITDLNYEINFIKENNQEIIIKIKTMVKTVVISRKDKITSNLHALKKDICNAFFPYKNKHLLVFELLPKRLKD